MRLKNIEMQGFKSFADKIYLDFNSGITAIVGPNGSGKSNISDAIRWVMGEQSIKSLRGSKMEDVIFSGTEQRKALGFAEVTLTLDNTDGYFALDFPEISVTRRVYRSGDGEYYINKTLCRLKDIHELFMDTGLGRDGYSIVGQGKIDSILSTKSEDRRQIFEEAAGISKYKYRKIEAERKLAQTVDNLTRVNDILSELEGQIGPLEKQADKAKKYLVLRDELRGLDINASIISIDKIKEEHTKLTEDLKLLNEQIKTIADELAETDEAIAGLYDKMRGCDEKINKFTEEERTITFQISDAEKNIGILRNDIEHNDENIKRLEAEINTVSESVKSAEGELDIHKKRLEELNAESEKNSAEIDKVNELVKNSDAAVGEKSSALEALRKQIFDITAAISSLRGSVENLNILKDSFLARKSDIEGELSGRGKDIEKLSEQLKCAKECEEMHKYALSDSEVKIRELENDLTLCKRKHSELSENRNKNLLELGRKRSRKGMLEDMEREFEGYAKGVKGVMTAYKDGRFKNSKIYGPLAQLIKTDKKYITAVETALAAAGQNIVTETETEAKQAIAYLKERHMGRATFLPVSAIRGRSFDDSQAKKCGGFIAVASELVECDPKFKDIVSSFLGATVVCDDIDNAVLMARQNKHKFRIVTVGGDVIQAGGAMTGGSAVKTTGSLSRTGEIDALKKEIASLEKTAAEEEKELKRLTEEIQIKETSAAEAAAHIQELRAEVVRAASDRERFSVLMDNANASNSQLNRELSDIIARVDELERDCEDKNQRIEDAIKERSDAESGAAGIEEEYNRVSGENERLAGLMTELNIKRSTILKDIEIENERISGINTGRGDSLESINIKRSGIETMKERSKATENQISELNLRVETLRKRADECRASSGEVAESRLKYENEVRERQSAVKDTQEQKFALSQRASKMEARCEKLTSDRENIINRMWEDYELTYSDALELRTDGEFDYKSATVRIRELKDLIKALGNINIDAIEEYKNVKERFDFLTVQTNDLEKAKKELDSVIDEMMTIMKSRFAEQFKIINTNFSRVFAELFGGGRANLSLTEPDDVLESGIEIEAQPPGKKLQSLTLLSGGERAFTAIALLFAILDVRPTPFCILDEIEAALDDVNVYRYADYLRRYSEKTQFIVVTHRRGTMEAANILYGVTMQERGISKLLALNIDEVKE